MKFSVAWLREWVDPPVDVHQLAEQLTMAGLEVDAVEAVAAPFSGVCVGRVLERQAHPEADKLSLCSVDVGDSSPLQIVCGAANVAAGQKVALAKVGALLPGGMKIKRAKLRGVESMGMICSAKELGMAESSEGILELAADAPLGEDLRRYLGLEDDTIEVDLTPDRGDCLGLAGIAREVGVINRIPVTAPPEVEVAAAGDERVSLALESPQACPRYLCRVVRGINPEARTPLWLSERLRRSGLRSISPLVDVTNYVMLELGQPMHAFDLATLEGGIRVRHAQAGERLTLLDGAELELREDTLVIADQQRPLAVAGIMGGEHSGVTDSTRDLLLESAFFAPAAVIGKARSYGLHTDSSHRFERGVDPGMQRRALERATALLVEIAGGTAGPIVEQVSAEHLPERPWILLRSARIARLLGLQIADEQVSDILQRLDMELEPDPQGWRVRAPSCRFDITIEADLIEEVGRIYGYSEIPVHQGAMASAMRPRRETRFELDRAKALLVDRDYQEVISYSFVNTELAAMLAPDYHPIRLANPISADMAVMRTSLWPGLIQAASYNKARQQSRMRLFESGLRFIDDAQGLRQQAMLAGLLTGSAAGEHWAQTAREADFYDLKGDLEALLALVGPGVHYRFVAQPHGALHPGQSAAVYRGEQPFGWIGMIHPQLEARLDLGGPTYVFEILLEEALEAVLPSFTPLSRFPSSRRDIALLVEQSVTLDQLLGCIREHGPEFLQDILVFDVYNGEKIEAGRKSLALGLIFQETTGNLNDARVDAGVAAILQALTQELQARLRE